MREAMREVVNIGLLIFFVGGSIAAVIAFLCRKFRKDGSYKTEER